MRQLYTSLVRSHVEYDHCIPSSQERPKVTEISAKESKKLKSELKECDHVDRLKALDFPSLLYRRHRGEMIECHKLTHDMYIMSQILKLEVNVNTPPRISNDYA